MVLRHMAPQYPHVIALADLAHQLPQPLRHVPHQHTIPVLRHPADVYLYLEYRMASPASIPRDRLLSSAAMLMLEAFACKARA